MKKPLFLAVLAAFVLAGCTTGTEGGGMTVQEKTCIRSLEQLAVDLGPGDEPAFGGVRDKAMEFREIASTWAPGDPPLDVRLWVDNARLVARILNNCESPETSLLMNIGGRLRLVDITLRPVPNPRPARRGRVEVIDLPPAEAEELEETEDADDADDAEEE